MECRLPADADLSPPAAAKLIASHDSAPLAMIVREMNKLSDNYVAECVLKTLGAETRTTPGPASWADGLAARQSYLATIGLGLVLILAGKIHLPLGRLPGDIIYRGKNTTFYFPLATSILLSALLSVVLYLVGRFRREGCGTVHCLPWARPTSLDSAFDLHSGACGRYETWWRPFARTLSGSIPMPGSKARSRIFGRRIPDIFTSP